MAGTFELTTASCGVSLYLHVPFCTGKCCYCDFFSLPDRSPRTVSRVVGETLRQARALHSRLGAPPIPTIFIGGGSPSSIPHDSLRQLLQGAALLAGVSPGAGAGTEAGTGSGGGPGFEWTVEANPESLDPELLSLFAETGVTRVSLGVQSFDPEILAAMGRRNDARAALAACELLAATWKGEVSFDLIAGYPGQDRRDAEADVRTALSFAPGHVSLYSLILEEGTRLEADVRAGSITLPSDEEAERSWLSARDVLIAAGYRPYEVSNFALPGKECRHNLRYWKMDPYLGCGPSAVSTLPSPGKPVRLTVPKDLSRFLSGEAAGWGIESEQIGGADLLLEHLMMGLRLREGIERQRIREIFGDEPERLIPETLMKYRRQIRRGKRSLALTDRGRLHLDALLRDAADEIEDATISGTTRWPWCPSPGL